jgi:regulator of PEP synthase PpsR (kinase-PPPase family)
MPIIYAVSDGTGTTADLVARAALTQFSTNVDVEVVREVREPEEVRNVIAGAAESDGIVVHTLVSRDLRMLMFREGRDKNVATLDLMGPLIARLSETLGDEPRAQPGLFRGDDAENVQRIRALDFAVTHDDGQHVADLAEAHIVLVGVSRVAKTPVSIYLAYRGWRVANVPLMLGVEPPKRLMDLPRKSVVGLVADPERLLALRRSRAPQLGGIKAGYADMDTIRKELAFAYEIFDRRPSWPVVDVTNKSIEEVASEILAVTGRTDAERRG